MEQPREQKDDSLISHPQLRALAHECAENNWDGNGAVAVDPIAVLNTENFLRALPDGIPLPELAPDPDGAISLDWITSRNRLFSLSNGKTDRLSFAWLDGSNTGHGMARFDGKNVPSRIPEGINGIVNNGFLSIRAELVLRS